MNIQIIPRLESLLCIPNFTKLVTSTLTSLIVGKMQWMCKSLQLLNALPNLASRFLYSYVFLIVQILTFNNVNYHIFDCKEKKM